MEIAYGEQIKRNIDSGDLDEVANVISQWELYTDELERDIQDKVAVMGMMQQQIQELGGALNEMVEEMSRLKKEVVQG
jgi:HAMP domain-containing protein